MKVDSSLLHATLKAVGKVCWSAGACVEKIYRPTRRVTLASELFSQMTSGSVSALSLCCSERDHPPGHRRGPLGPAPPVRLAGQQCRPTVHRGVPVAPPTPPPQEILAVLLLVLLLRLFAPQCKFARTDLQVPDSQLATRN